MATRRRTEGYARHVASPVLVGASRTRTRRAAMRPAARTVGNRRRAASTGHRPNGPTWSGSHRTV